MAASSSRAHRPKRERATNLTDQEILDIIFDGDSEIEGFSDDTEEYTPSEKQPSDRESSSEDEAEEGHGEVESSAAVPTNARERRLIWRAEAFEPKLTSFIPSPCEGNEIRSPVQYFSEYFPEEIWDLMTTNTNLYSVQQTGKSLNASPNEMKTFVGAHIIMGTLNFPRVRLYWSSRTRVSIIADSISRDRFFNLRNSLHFVNNLLDKDTNDDLWKIRPLINQIQKVCLSLPRPKVASIDEQMIPFTGHTKLRQYVRGKPNPTGLKNFVLASVDGKVLDFEIYQGAKTKTVPGLGLGGGIVMRLKEFLPSNADCVLCFDRYFTSPQLADALLSDGIYCIGTVMGNRTDKVKFSSDKEMMKGGRGSHEEKVRSDGKLVQLKWMDTRSVIMMSTCLGSQPLDQVDRYDKKKKYIKVNRPAAVREHNRLKGGVDLNDFLISLYRINIKTKKWTVKVSFHFVDLALVNSWLEYRADCRARGIPEKDILDLMEFRMDVAEALILCGRAVQTSKRGRPMSSSPLPQKKRKSVAALLPISDVRFDGCEHYPEQIAMKNSARCRNTGCAQKSQVRCLKCRIFLCLKPERNCFLNFHRK